MSFNWSEYLTLAQELAGRVAGSSQEARFRSAISRAYYGAFCSTKNYLKNHDYDIPKSGEAHKVVRDILANMKGQIFKQIESNLARLWKDRKNADYEDQFPGVLDKTTKKDLYFAQEVINDLAKC